MTFTVGQIVSGIDIGPVAHGGHFVARADGMVIFVRGGLTGERVDVAISDVTRRFARGDVVAVHRASPLRVEPPCPIAGRCGGCDFQHVSAAGTRELKRQVVAELLGHLAGYSFTGEVEEVEPSPAGWRTRMRYRLDSRGRPGLSAHRSNRVVTLPESGCLLAVPSIARPDGRPGERGELLAVAAASGVVVDTAYAVSGTVQEDVMGRPFTVAADGFWQAHVGAPEALVTEVLRGLAPQAGEVAADLFCGSGLFARFLADAGCRVLGIEGDATAQQHARGNVPEADFLCGDVSLLVERLPTEVDLVVLDPPRTGAGKDVLTAVLRRHPRAVSYVACDPAALGRDLRIAQELGYRVESVRAFDLFPLTHHVECVAVLKPA